MGAFERITVDVPAEAAEAMRRSVAEGVYDSADDIVGMALQDWADEQSFHETELNRLRQLIAEGDSSGPTIPAEKVFAALRERLTKRLQAR